MRYGALEAGGTKMVLAVMDDHGNLMESVSIPTRAPDDTMPEMISFFSGKGISSLGIGSFGPLDLNPASPAYGSVTESPKLSWRHFPLRQAFADALQVPVSIDTDVNAAALAEFSLGAARGKQSCLYVTVGTGIGGGLIIHGKPVHGLMHPEIGHILLPPDPEDPSPDGFCPYHRHCLEGLASGPAVEKRWGIPGRDLPAGHPAWHLEAHYLAQLCVNAIMAFSPEMIILGGGIMQQKHLFPLIRKETARLLNGYIPESLFGDGMNTAVSPSASRVFGDRQPLFFRFCGSEGSYVPSFCLQCCRNTASPVSRRGGGLTAFLPQVHPGVPGLSSTVQRLRF